MAKKFRHLDGCICTECTTMPEYLKWMWTVAGVFVLFLLYHALGVRWY